MEPYANYYLEKELANYGIEIKRYTNVHYLLFEKKKEAPKLINYAYEYVKYKMGADAADNIGRTKYLCRNNYDGIIHIKSSFCTPEIGAMPIINKICSEYSIPVLFLSMDSNTSEVGLKTRIEAFYDMIKMKRK
jgi:benzoyl-CoA reductase/2-hydroxyglutaryl-CoA dehydratase subunit BcrC/BadD/HgdB